MKTINELTKRELADLNEVQVDAYIDIELAQQNVVKPINTIIDYPEYLKVFDSMPEKDVTIYEAGDYAFPDLETAQKFVNFVNQLPIVRKDYDYQVGSNAYYASEVQYPSVSIQMVSVYSLAKFSAVREQIKQINEAKKKAKNENDDIVESVINYEAIDEVKHQIISKVREAIEFFAQAEKIATDYAKYLEVTGDSEKAKEVLFTVYNVQDKELKQEVNNLIDKQE